ncbi:MAG: tRNA pseudouridine(55) synthase, partial [Clostridiales bacterium]|nr:tRNA pseudouridine(55) synthase [Clostridiales bacterium]
PVEIMEIHVDELSLPRVSMTVTCSKGTYIRTLCHDIGRRLGCGGCMESLIRIRVGRFSLEDCFTLSQIESLRDAGKLQKVIMPIDGIFKELPEIIMSPGEGDKLVHNGNPFPPLLAAKPDGFRYERVRVYDSNYRFIGIYGFYDEIRRYKPIKIFLGGSADHADYHRDETV